MECDFFYHNFSWIVVMETAVIICDRNVNAVLIVYNDLINICPSNGHSFDDTLLIMPHSLGLIIKYRKKLCLLIIQIHHVQFVQCSMQEILIFNPIKPAPIWFNYFFAACKVFLMSEFLEIKSDLWFWQVFWTISL